MKFISALRRTGKLVLSPSVNWIFLKDLLMSLADIPPTFLSDVRDPTQTIDFSVEKHSRVKERRA